MPCHVCGGPGGHSAFECADYGYIPSQDQGDKVDEITTLRQRAEAAEQGAQQQRERADRLSDAYFAKCGQNATLEAALTRAHLALQGAWALLPPEDGERLGIKRLMLECERPECAAFAAQPPQEQEVPRG